MERCWDVLSFQCHFKWLSVVAIKKKNEWNSMQISLIIWLPYHLFSKPMFAKSQHVEFATSNQTRPSLLIRMITKNVLNGGPRKLMNTFFFATESFFNYLSWVRMYSTVSFRKGWLGTGKHLVWKIEGKNGQIVTGDICLPFFLKFTLWNWPNRN